MFFLGHVNGLPTEKNNLNSSDQSIGKIFDMHDIQSKACSYFKIYAEFTDSLHPHHLHGNASTSLFKGHVEFHCFHCSRKTVPQPWKCDTGGIRLQHVISLRHLAE